MTTPPATALVSTQGTIPWAELPDDARDKFTAWMATDPTGQAVAAEADGDMDYAVWLIAVDLTFHQVTSTSYTSVAGADWRARYDAGRTPGQAIYDTMRAAQ